ncbi:MAG: deoxyguanosinetriphosphate triphosphohydrolase [Bauldia sp.]|nr:deoxyguanosinetriphosphate triphosphohydrolase [Bauldia sp.]
MTAAPPHDWRRPGARAPWAADPATSRGRWIEEAPSGRRTPFERDRDRIIHSTAFRRLKGKTQVFLADEGDHFRTRLTHTLEVAQIARSLARSLGLDEDLAEAIALAHDLGHPPFGHSGERALDRAARPFGGFDHNVQSLRVVTALERRYPAFDGLNLSYEVIEGLVKHNGPVAAGATISPTVAALSSRHDLGLALHPTLEAQCAAIADDVAYNTHDIDDGLRAGLLTIDGLREVPALAAILDGIALDHEGIDRSRLVPELLRRLIHLLVEDILVESGRRIADAAPASVDDVRVAGRALVGFSPEIAAAERAVRQHLSRHVYRDAGVLTVMGAAEAVVTALFVRFRSDPEALPPEWRAGLDDAPEERKGRRIADFLAGMTDRFALNEYRRLFDRTPDFG